MTASQSGLDDDTVEFFVDGEGFSFADVNPDEDSSHTFTKISSKTFKFGDPSEAVAASTFTNNVVDTPELTIHIHDHRVVPAGEPGKDQGSAPIILFEFTATNKTNEPHMLLLLSGYFRALQSEQFAGAPSSPRLHRLTCQRGTQGRKRRKRHGVRPREHHHARRAHRPRSPLRQGARPSYLSGQLAPAFRCTPYPSPALPSPLVIIAAPPRSTSPGIRWFPSLVAKTPKQKEETPQSKRFLLV
ncbi:hypothetical protein [Corynebacterium phoceense]|uniref:hypothetical protein n=1 Tax=Corynebacterium phoceense TaxID=1686286 RepID=UPI00211C7FDA|nr:hypothetical protein [Corynebacterium phoceense]MCQ9346665.1 hypothetical protein [Corynebacterium phoceense]